MPLINRNTTDLLISDLDDDQVHDLTILAVALKELIESDNEIPEALIGLGDIIGLLHTEIVETDAVNLDEQDADLLDVGDLTINITNHYQAAETA